MTNMKKPRKLTEMQAAYVQLRAQGVKRKDSAIGAGYSPAAADQQSYALEHREDIKKAIAEAKRAIRKGVSTAPKSDLPKDDNDELQGMPKATYADSKEFLSDLMNNRKLPLALRGDYAKALLPYQHARVGEDGKKEKARKQAAATTATGPFRPKRAPGRLAVN